MRDRELGSYVCRVRPEITGSVIMEFLRYGTRTPEQKRIYDADEESQKITGFRPEMFPTVRDHLLIEGCEPCVERAKFFVLLQFVVAEVAENKGLLDGLRRFKTELDAYTTGRN